MFINTIIYSQNLSNISISSNYEVGCQEFQNIERDKFKDPIFLESIQDGDCIRVCEQTSVIYTLNNLPNTGVTTQWSVVGGVILSQTSSTCQIKWSEAGSASLSFTISTSSSVINKNICFEKINKPRSFFNVLPPVQGTRLILACLNQTLYFTNQSSPNGGTALVSPYLWDFGDGTYSTAFEPTHAYTTDGEYDVSLTVYNSCNCSTVFKRKVKVIKYQGFDLVCPAVVCDGDKVTYSLPEDIASACTESINPWSVEGGEIIGFDPQQGEVEILWNNVNQDGFGYVTFNPSECFLKCYVPSTLKVPVIQKNATIEGPQTACLKEQVIYKMPQWPTTDFRWEILDNVNGALAEVLLSDQRNEVIIRPWVLGQLRLRCTYTNTLLDCGGSAEFIINVEGYLPINGPSTLCKNTIGSYQTQNNQAVNWVLKKANGQLIHTATNVSNYSYNFTVAGGYSLIAGAQNTCGQDEFLINVVDVPISVDPNDIKVSFNGTLTNASTTKICPNIPYNYSLPILSNHQYIWSVTNGTIVGSNIGNSVMITFNDSTPAQISVIKQSINPLLCSSLPTIITVPFEQINAQIVSITNPSSNAVCANSINDYQVNFFNTSTIYNEGESYNWSLSNPLLGSIIAGQGTNAVSVAYNNVNALTTGTLNLTITKCNIPPQIIPFTVTINPIPAIAIQATPNPVCGGSSVSFSLVSTNGVPIPANATVNWNFGGGIVSGGINNSFIFLNSNNVNITKNVTAQLIGVCNGNSNLANIAVIVRPQPKATLSLSPGNFNSFCNQSDINATLTVASSTSGITSIQWYKDNILIPGATGTTLLITPTLGFGSYHFVVTNANGCTNQSNPQNIIQYCGEVPACTIAPDPQVVNNASQQCGRLTLSSTFGTTPLSSNWSIFGPNFSLINTNQSPINLINAGVYQTILYATYPGTNGNPCTIGIRNDVIVPYIPDFAYNATCSGSNSFTVTLTDKSSFYAPVEDRTVTYSYRLGATGNFIPVTGTTFTATTQGTYQIKIVIQGKLGTILQTACEKIITTFPLVGVPNNSITLVDGPLCHYTAVRFGLFTQPAITDNLLWTFEPGTPNQATNTNDQPYREFTTPGLKTVTVTVTNRLGCSRTFTTTVTIPPKCFRGTITSTPVNPTVCAGSSIVLNYVPNGDTCNATQYQWMNGLTLVTTTTEPSLTVSTNGTYWVRVKNADCDYDVPNRVTPIFRPLPSIQLTAPPATCFGNAVQLTATTTATVLRWFINTVPQTAFDNQSSITLSNLPTGTHTITATVYSGAINATSTCSSSVSQFVTIVSAPVAPTISVQVNCPSTEVGGIPYYNVDLTASSPSTGVYTWSNGMNGANITVPDGGPYQVRLSNGGCSSTAQVVVPKNPEDYIWIFPSGCYDFCEKEADFNSLIGPRLPLHYWSWNNYNIDGTVLSEGHDDFANEQDIENSGNYSLTINTGTCSLESKLMATNVTACEKCDVQEVHLIRVVKNEATRFCSFLITFELSSVAGFEGIITAPNDELYFDPSSIVFLPGTHTYTVTAIPLGNFIGGTVIVDVKGFLNGFPCTEQFVVNLPSCNEEVIESKTQIITNDKKLLVLVYPNPAQDSVTIQYTNMPHTAQMYVYDLQGKELKKDTVQQGDSSVHIDTSIFAAGMYIVVTKLDGVFINQQKLIIN
jgi:PKD repeat protein